MKPKIAIVGDGVFGTFLRKELAPHADIVEYNDAKYAILAVPISAYDEAAHEWNNKHLVNICSVQTEADKICRRYNPKHVTSIHPMFGPNSPREGRTCILTHMSDDSYPIIELFAKISNEVVSTVNGERITPQKHDEMMRKTHLPVLMFGELAALIVEQAADVPDNCLPTSFKRLKALAEQMRDMSPGTVESIRSNR